MISPPRLVRHSSRDDDTLGAGHNETSVGSPTLRVLLSSPRKQPPAHTGFPPRAHGPSDLRHPRRGRELGRRLSRRTEPGRRRTKSPDRDPVPTGLVFGRTTFTDERVRGRPFDREPGTGGPGGPNVWTDGSRGPRQHYFTGCYPSSPLFRLTEGWTPDLQVLAPYSSPIGEGNPGTPCDRVRGVRPKTRNVR